MVLLFQAAIFTVLLAVSSWLQDDYRTTSIRSLHTAFKVRSRSWHRHGVCLCAFFWCGKKYLSQIPSRSPHASHWWEFSLMTTSNCKTGKENSWLSKSLYGGQTREKEYVAHKQPLPWSPAVPVRAMGTFTCIRHLTALVWIRDPQMWHTNPVQRKASQC